MGYQYKHCACVSNVTIGNTTAFTARPGACVKECGFLMAYIAVTVLTTFMGMISAIPMSVAVLRSVSERDKGIAVGVSSFVASLIGWTLGPVLYGRIVDSTCKLWHISCAKRGACAIYDLADFRMKFHGMASGGRFVGLLLFLVCLLNLLWTSKEKQEIKSSDPTVKPGNEVKNKMLAKFDYNDDGKSLEPMPVRISSV